MFGTNFVYCYQSVNVCLLQCYAKTDLSVGLLAEL